jgi:hypothetical protein
LQQAKGQLRAAEKQPLQRLSKVSQRGSAVLWLLVCWISALIARVCDCQSAPVAVSQLRVPPVIVEPSGSSDTNDSKPHSNISSNSNSSGNRKSSSNQSGDTNHTSNKKKGRKKSASAKTQPTSRKMLLTTPQ